VNAQLMIENAFLLVVIFVISSLDERKHFWNL